MKLSDTIYLSLIDKNMETSFAYHNEKEKSTNLSCLNNEEIKIYKCIKEAVNGIEIRDLRDKTNLNTHIIFKTLKKLEHSSLIKSYHSSISGNKKMFYASDIVISPPNTFSAWYTETEFNIEFVSLLQEMCLRQIRNQGGCKLEELSEEIHKQKYFKELHAEDINSIVHTLILDGLVEIVGDEDDNNDFFRITEKTPSDNISLINVPCGVCPVSHDCDPDGAISPHNCVYYENWLDF
jgi:DNA-directed RNA polymerase III subunit RPC6